MAGEGERVTAYMQTLGRIEQEIAMLDRDTSLVSIAISLKRIADVMEQMVAPDTPMAPENKS